MHTLTLDMDKAPNLVLTKGSKYPLMTLECFNKWTHDGVERGRILNADVGKLRCLLYGEDGKGGVDGQGIPLGLLLIFNLVPTTRMFLG